MKNSPCCTPFTQAISSSIVRNRMSDDTWKFLSSMSSSSVMFSFLVTFIPFVLGDSVLGTGFFLVGDDLGVPCSIIVFNKFSPKNQSKQKNWRNCDEK